MNDPRDIDWLPTGFEESTRLDYDYKVHKLALLPPRMNCKDGPVSEIDKLMQTIDQCLVQADYLDLKIAGLKLKEAYDAVKASLTNK